MDRSLAPIIHTRGKGARLDAVLDLVAFCSRPRPLPLWLDEVPARIARVLAAHVCSIYLLEGEDLVMRGNVGFPAGALGEVRLPVGQGITGRCVEFLRPISVGAAPKHVAYRHFPGLGEEQFPIFLAVPVLGPRGAQGALVLQRAQAEFTPADLELAAALTAPIAAAVERARLADALGSKRSAEVNRSRKVTLTGRPLVPGRAWGALCTVPRHRPRGGGEAVTTAAAKRALDRAVARARRTLTTAAHGAAAQGRNDEPLRAVVTILDDARLRERALELVAEGATLTKALGRLGAEAVRAAGRGAEAFVIDRARDIAEVCEALALLASGGDKLALPPHAVLAADDFTTFELLVAAGSRPSAVVLAGEVRKDSALHQLEALGVPAVSEVSALFRWIQDGDVAVVDGRHGLVRLNPSQAELAEVRALAKS